MSNMQTNNEDIMGATLSYSKSNGLMPIQPSSTPNSSMDLAQSLQTQQKQQQLREALQQQQQSIALEARQAASLHSLNSVMINGKAISFFAQSTLPATLLTHFYLLWSKATTLFFST